jgi:hypothetical protein
MDKPCNNIMLIINDINQSTEDLIDVLSNFPLDKFNEKIGPDTWSAGDIAEHLIILENLVNQIIKGKTKPADRNPEQKIELIKSTFLNFDKKLCAGKPIAPTNRFKDKVDIIKKIKDCRQNLIETMKNCDPTLMCLDFAHQIFGELSRIEWVYYNIYHSERHFIQIKNIQ